MVKSGYFNKNGGIVMLQNLIDLTLFEQRQIKRSLGNGNFGATKPGNKMSRLNGLRRLPAFAEKVLDRSVIFC